MIRKRKRSGIAAAFLSVFCGAFAAEAQETYPTPAIRPSTDGNGVELFSGLLQSDRTDIVIGQPGAGGLTYRGIPPVGVQPHPDFSGSVTPTNYGYKVVYAVAIDNYAETFERLNGSSTFTSLQGKGRLRRSRRTRRRIRTGLRME